MNTEMEFAKAQATLQNLITSVKADAEVDVLGSLLALQDQFERLDEAINEEM